MNNTILIHGRDGYMLTHSGSSLNELYHHGVKGQRWGVRRYQNEDGSLTNAGKNRSISERIKDPMVKWHKQSVDIRKMSDSDRKKYTAHKIGSISVIALAGMAAVTAAFVGPMIYKALRASRNAYKSASSTINTGMSAMAGMGMAGMGMSGGMSSSELETLNLLKTSGIGGYRG